MKTKTIVALAFLIAGSQLKAQSDFIIEEVAQNVDYNYFFKHVLYFASDELKGRDVGSEGFDLAATYTANEFKANNLLPFGDNGSYFQDISFINAQIIEPSFKMNIAANESAVTGTFGENVSVYLNTKSTSFSTDNGLVFVGYGNVIPELNIDDYKNLDVKDKIVIVSFGAPKGVSHSSINNPLTKIQHATDKGAKGVIAFYPKKGLFQGLIFKSLHEFIGAPKMVIDDSVLNKQFIDIEFLSFVKKDFLKSVFKTSNANFGKEIKAMKNGEFVSKPIDANLTCSYDMNFTSLSCKNVVGVLPGTDSILKNDYIVVGAHLDHLGVGKPIKGDSIYNGMWDNATGSSATISISKTLNDANISTKRSIIFINYTAEEKGLYGSYYFANSDLVKDKNIVANVNIDMLGGLYETSDITPVGYSHSNISEAVDFAAEILNVTISDATKFEELYVHRSDQYSFIETGTPIISVEMGTNSIGPKVDVVKNTEKWMEKLYHSPFDDLNQEYSDNAFHLALKANFLVTYYLANEIPEIKWNEDSWILEKYVEK